MSELGDTDGTCYIFDHLEGSRREVLLLWDDLNARHNLWCIVILGAPQCEGWSLLSGRWKNRQKCTIYW